MYTIIAVVCVVCFVVALAVAAWRWQQPVYKFTGLGVSAATLAVAVVVPTLNWKDSGDSTPGDAKSFDITLSVEDNTDVDLCLRGVRGTGRAAEGEAMALLVRGLSDAQYYLAHHIPDDEDWGVPRFQVGAVKTKAGTLYELVIWRFDAEMAGVARHLTKAQFKSRPPGVHEVARRKVIRKAATEKDVC
ncbi:hypothetical protein [Streptomyces sp. NPDC055506]